MNELGPKHEGMRVSVTGLISNAIRDFRASKGSPSGNCFMLAELSRHLEELATRFYAGDVMVVDEFLQLYCLDDNRPKEVATDGN